MKKIITKRSEDYAKWYLDVIEAADMAEHSPVKGCMVIKPYGYALWENMRAVLDAKFKETGHQNAYFPLFIPKSLLSKEAGHIKGFAKECAVVTHYRLTANSDGDGIVVDPSSKLEEELIVRPTSETIMYETFSKWIQSWRDLPLLINQWANVVRFEMRTRLFLRTTEFLWQEGHTAHASEEEAEDEAKKMLDIYKNFAEKYLAISPIVGVKSEEEKFPGALRTYSIEAIMQDGKALQTGTSHNLGQNFAKAFNVRFTDKEGVWQYVWQTSWGVSTRLIGGIIMSHSDDKGLVLPPRLAPIPAVVIPIWKTEEERTRVLEECKRIIEETQEVSKISIKLDDRDYYSPGFKFNEWEKKGVPVRIEIGPREVAEQQAVVVRRDTGIKRTVKYKDLPHALRDELTDIQRSLYEKNRAFREKNSYTVDDYRQFKQIIEDTPGFIYSHWCGNGDCEKRVSNETKATIRCIPFDSSDSKGVCIVCKGLSLKRVLFAKAY